MMRSKYNETWSKNLRYDEKLDLQVQNIRKLLDPFKLTDCTKCGGEKHKDDFVCTDCSNTCPDPDHRERKTQPAEAESSMCQHCDEFLRTLDLPCSGRPESCRYPPCLDAQDDSSPAICSGRPKMREGFFVYQLDTGYIGMTYNPSRRQVEHEARVYVEHQERMRRGNVNPIRDKDAYIHKVSGEWVKDFPTEYTKHWEKVRNSDQRQSGECKIKWLSPVLNNRQIAWRCEWALKDYEKGKSPLASSRFKEITSVSSVPLLHLESADLTFDHDSQDLLFGLKWSLSKNLGPSQIVPVKFDEIEQYDSVLGQWVQITGNLTPTSVGYDDKNVTENYQQPLSTISGCTWRVRAVNDVGIPGPWAELVLSDSEISDAISRFFRIYSLETTLRKGTGIVEVKWSINDQPEGIRFFIERKELNSGISVLMESNVSSFVDKPEPNDIEQYSYRVQACWKGYRSEWSITSHVLVGSAVPDRIKGLKCTYCDLKNIILSFNPPEWHGYSSVVSYEIQKFSDYWQTVDAQLSDVYSYKLRDVLSGRSRYRVRAINSHGSGRWSEEVDSRIRICDSDQFSYRSVGIFQIGQTVNGIVESVKGFGAFVRIDDAFTGLLPVSELSWFGNPQVFEVVKIGNELTLKVIKIDVRQFKHKISLSLRRIQGSPWDAFPQCHKKGDVVNGVVDGLADFGAFVRLGTIKGLIHKSELGENKAKHPSEMLHVGQFIKVKIIKIDVDRRRVALSIRNL